jgi:hypothetical protein
MMHGQRNIKTVTVVWVAILTDSLEVHDLNFRSEDIYLDWGLSSSDQAVGGKLLLLADWNKNLVDLCRKW